MKEVSEFSMPKLYDIFNDNYIEDIAWYIKRLKQFSSILELGVGTGRIAIPLAQQGYDVWGVDNAPEMLRALEEKIKGFNSKNIHTINQDFRCLDIPFLFEAAIIPFCTFNFLLSYEDQMSTLLSLKKVMAQNAIIVFDLITEYTFNLDEKPTKYSLYRKVENDTSITKIYLKNYYDRKKKILNQTRLIRIYNNNNLVEEYSIKMKNRIIYLEELRKLLEFCGYKVEKIYGDFYDSPYNNYSRNLIVIARLK